jgi:hypothetical protein
MRPPLLVRAINVRHRKTVLKLCCLLSGCRQFLLHMHATIEVAGE